LVATASLELGIDIGAVDLVPDADPTARRRTLLQRVGRSGHHLPRCRRAGCPVSRDELIECAAWCGPPRAGGSTGLIIPAHPLDIPGAADRGGGRVRGVAGGRAVRAGAGGVPYRDLSRKDFDAVVQMLAEGSRRAASRARVCHVARLTSPACGHGAPPAAAS